jgi:hypothetical protein
MTPENAQGTVVTAMAVTGGIRVASAAIAQQTPPARVLIGLGFSTLVLATLAMWAPALAASLALLVAVSATFVYGGPLWAQLTKTLGK